MRIRIRTSSFAVAAMVTTLVVGCGGDSPTDGGVPADDQDFAGSWEATEFAVSFGGPPQDILSDGGSLDIVLTLEGVTSGTLVIPGSQTPNGEQAIFDLAGTWSRNGNVVTFEQTADTFVRDMEFEMSEGTLVGEDVFGGALVRVVLTRS